MSFIERLAVERYGLPSMPEVEDFIWIHTGSPLARVSPPLVHTPSGDLFRLSRNELGEDFLVHRGRDGNIYAEVPSIFEPGSLQRFMPSNHEGLSNPSNSIMQHTREINALLSKMPSEWKNQLASSRQKLRAAGARAKEIPSLKPDAHEAMKALNLNNQGSLSSEVGAHGGEPVPEDVRHTAMEGIRLSHRHNYGGYDFIGVARAIQLAISPRISAQAKNRMRMYFDRKYTQDRLSDQYKEKYGKRYWSWLNWGGDPGAVWSGSSKIKRPKNNASQRASRLVGWYTKARHAGGSYG